MRSVMAPVRHRADGVDMSDSFFHTLSRRLDLDWANLRHHRPSLATARSWNLLPVDVELVDLQQFIAMTHRELGIAGDQLLGRLVLRSRDDDLAGRIVMQRIFPGLVARSARYWFLSDGVDPIDVSVPASWMAIRQFDVERRPRHIAASLISDTIHVAFKRPNRRVSRVDVVPDLDDTPMPSTVGAFEELARVVATARQRGVDDEHLELLRHLVRAGTPTQVAVDRGVTTRTVRNHRDRAIRHIRQVVAA